MHACVRADRLYSQQADGQVPKIKFAIDILREAEDQPGIA